MSITWNALLANNAITGSVLEISSTCVKTKYCVNMTMRKECYLQICLITTVLCPRLRDRPKASVTISQAVMAALVPVPCRKPSPHRVLFCCGMDHVQYSSIRYTMLMPWFAMETRVVIRCGRWNLIWKWNILREFFGILLNHQRKSFKEWWCHGDDWFPWQQQIYELYLYYTCCHGNLHPYPYLDHLCYHCCSNNFFCFYIFRQKRVTTCYALKFHWRKGILLPRKRLVSKEHIHIVWKGVPGEKHSNHLYECACVCDICFILFLMHYFQFCLVEYVVLGCQSKLTQLWLIVYNISCWAHKEIIIQGYEHSIQRQFFINYVNNMFNIL